MGMDVSTSGEATYTIVTDDDTNKVIILNRKELEAGIKACGIGGSGSDVIELLGDDDDDNSIDTLSNKKENVLSTAPTTTTTTSTPTPTSTPTLFKSEI